jgi:hypothetical protein
MTKSKAIRQFCLDCAGSAKDVVFCAAPGAKEIPLCPLWEYRLGSDLKSKSAQDTLAANIKRYPKDFAELKDYGCDPELYKPLGVRKSRSDAQQRAGFHTRINRKKNPLPTPTP